MKKFLAFGLTLGVIFVSCKEDRLLNTDRDKPSMTEKRSNIGDLYQQPIHVKGRINIYMSEDSFDKISISEQGSMQMNSLPTPMQATLITLKATRVERLFPPAGKYEKRTREAGLHRWFTVTFDESTPSEEACQMMSELPEVDFAEPILKIAFPQAKPAPVTMTGMMSLRGEMDPESFNDPMLRKQWHYRNSGAASFAEKGADINLFPAWRVESGSAKVTVAIVDGGIDIDHEDLKENLSINTAELNGAKDVDDDNNGFVDDIYGYNFVTNSPTIEPDDYSHGTHVAGTVSARNNNGLGVCGIAGGNGTEGTGVKLLSCQIFRKEHEKGNAEAALKYGADNGAVISQNSWGYPHPTAGTTPKSLRDAIDYFIKYAGCDENGNQRADSPMKGGVVIFAAGNQNLDFVAIPAAYSKVISVSAMSPNFTRASYTNRGTWVTIMAPGGDQDRYGTTAGVLSTLSPKVPDTRGAKYGYMQGTSMACPHVSGVAALMVSHFGGKGYTNADLVKQLKSAFLDVDINEKNPGFEGRLGVGYIDAHGALVNKNLNKAPNTPVVDMERSSKTEITEINLFWTIPTDEDDKKPSRLQLFMSKQPLTASNYREKGTPIGMGTYEYISIAGHNAGEEMSFSIKDLSPETSYYFALVAIDRWGLKSAPAIFDLKTRPNIPPQVTGMPQGPIRVNASLGQTFKFELTVADPDGHSWKMEKPAYMKGVTVQQKKSDEKVLVSIYPTLPEGKHQFSLVFVDQLGGKTEVVIAFEIYKITPPKLLMPISNKVMGVAQGAVEVDLTKVFEGDKETTLTYSASGVDTSIASAVIDGSKLIINPHKPGESIISVTAKDGIDNVVDTKFQVLVVADKSLPVYSVYPIPARTDLNAWLNDEVKTATFVITTMRGEEVFRREVKPNDEGVATIDIKKFAPGAYNLTITSTKGTFTKTIVKQ